MGGVNLYQYSPNPVGWVDPYGLQKKRGNKEDNAQATLNNKCSQITRVRHYNNRKGANNIEDSGAIIVKDNNRVYVEPARNKPLSPKDAEEKYQIGRGRDYIETDVESHKLEWIKKTRYHSEELSVKGNSKLKNHEIIKRK